MRIDVMRRGLGALAGIQVPGLDWYQNDEVRHRFAGKLTWQAGAGTNLYGTVFGDPASQDAVDAPRYYSSGLQPLTADSWLSSRRLGGITALAGLTQTMGSTGLLEVTLSRLWVTASRQPRTPGGAEPQFNDFTAGTMSGGLWASYTDDQTRTALRAVATWSLGRHTLKAGGEYTGNQLDTDWSHLVLEKRATECRPPVGESVPGRLRWRGCPADSQRMATEIGLRPDSGTRGVAARVWLFRSVLPGSSSHGRRTEVQWRVDLALHVVRS